MSSTTEPGWYPDPDNPEVERWFDGTNWSQLSRDPNAELVDADTSAPIPEPSVAEPSVPETEIGSPEEQSSAIQEELFGGPTVEPASFDAPAAEGIVTEEGLVEYAGVPNDSGVGEPQGFVASGQVTFTQKSVRSFKTGKIAMLIAILVLVVAGAVFFYLWSTRDDSVEAQEVIGLVGAASIAVDEPIVLGTVVEREPSALIPEVSEELRVCGDSEETAWTALQNWRANSAELSGFFLESWVPQLAVTWLGMANPDDQTNERTSLLSICRQHAELEIRFPETPIGLMTNQDFHMPDLTRPGGETVWISFAGWGYETAHGAYTWCTGNELLDEYGSEQAAARHCGARLLTYSNVETACTWYEMKERQPGC